ncbi:MAG TPA: putative glycolipid-binding domain-containing protein [Candidatus Limnocylindrales bacterium]|nr:putative glycolipid-binding domain-containing protein [Candidatus Limnocylindrales bacterium]
MTIERFLAWQIDDSAGFDAAWATVERDTLRAEGRSVGQRPAPFWTTYRLETGPAFVTARMEVESRSAGGRASLDLRRDHDGTWRVDGEPRPDLAGALDCDLGECPLTNTMPVLRHGLLDGPGDHELLMAFIEVPGLRVLPSRQRYTHVAREPTGDTIVTYRSGTFRSDLRFDRDGFVRTYPQLGRRIEPDDARSSESAAT